MKLKTLIATLALAVTFSLTACKKKEAAPAASEGSAAKVDGSAAKPTEAPPAPADPAAGSAAPAAGSAAPATGSAAPAGSAAAPAAGAGLPECEAYLKYLNDVFMKCEKVEKVERDRALAGAMKAKKEDWDNPEITAELKTHFTGNCKINHEALKGQTDSMGCK